MRRTLAVLASAAFATLALSSLAFASPGTRPDMELTLTPDGPTTGSAVLIQAYVHYGTKPYHFQVSGASLPAWAQPVAGGIALLAALGISALLFRRRAMTARTVTATN